MKLYKVGEKSKAICSYCEGMVSTAFQERDVPLSSGKGTVSNVLVGVCDRCDRVVSIPQQSTPRIQEMSRSSRHSVEARVPRHLLDALNLACHNLGYGASESRQTILFRYFVNRISRSKEMLSRLPALLELDEAHGKANARFSIKLNDELYELFMELQNKTSLSQADLVRGIIMEIKRDLLDRQNEGMRDNLREILRLAG